MPCDRKDKEKEFKEKSLPCQDISYKKEDDDFIPDLNRKVKENESYYELVYLLSKISYFPDLNRKVKENEISIVYN